MATSELELEVSPASTVARTYMPLYKLEEAADRRKILKSFVREHLVEDVDYGSAGMGKLPSLKKPGAEKFISWWGCNAKLELTSSIEDWTGEQHGNRPLFAYTYNCSIWRGNTFVAEATGHCNSWESKYGRRWVNQDQVPKDQDISKLPRRDATIEEFQFAIQKKETTGPYGKPLEYWMQFEEAIKAGKAKQTEKTTASGAKYPAWQIPGVQFQILNPEPYDAVNTCIKMAGKRALVGAVLIGFNVSDYFTADLDDQGDDDRPPAPTTPPPSRAGAPIPVAVQQPVVPPIQKDPEVPPEIEAIWKRMAVASTDDRTAEFRPFKIALIERLGEEAGREKYYEVLGRYGVEHATQFRYLTPARRAIAELWQATQTK
jgi:hypothetical protein